MVVLKEVDYYISENILHSEVWDNATDVKKNKAINQSNNMLLAEYPNLYPDNNIPIEHIAYQSIWLMKIDDSIQRAELGVKFIMVDGISMNLDNVDKTIAPYVKRLLGFNKRKVGSYAPTTTLNTYRKGW